MSDLAYSPSPVAMFVNPSGSQWQPLEGTSSGDPIAFTPPPSALHTLNPITGLWTPWTGSPTGPIDGGTY